MRAAMLDKPHPPALVFKQDEVLPQEPHEAGRVIVREFAGRRDGVPEAPKPLPGGRAWSNTGIEIVFFLRQQCSYLLFAIVSLTDPVVLHSTVSGSLSYFSSA